MQLMLAEEAEQYESQFVVQRSVYSCLIGAIPSYGFLLHQQASHSDLEVACRLYACNPMPLNIHQIVVEYDFAVFLAVPDVAPDVARYQDSDTQSVFHLPNIAYYYPDYESPEDAERDEEVSREDQMTRKHSYCLRLDFVHETAHPVVVDGRFR